MGVEFHDYSFEVKKEITKRINAALRECGGALVSRVKRNSRVDTGKTRNSFAYRVDEAQHIAYIGSDDPNAIWEELGTGEYALNGDGRKGGWSYKDEEGNWHRTNGKKPSRAFWRAYSALKSKIKKQLQDCLKGL